MSNIARYDHSSVLQHMQVANAQLANEVRNFKASQYKKLFQQTRSFIDAMERCPLSRHRSYGASIVTIRQVHDCYRVSQKLDGERTTHYTVLLGYFLHLSDELRQLVVNAREWLGDPIEQLTVHAHQEERGRKIMYELQFWGKFLNEDNDFTDLHKYKTLEEFRGLNAGEVSIYGAVVNLLPIMLKTIEGITDEVTKWLNTTYRLGMGIFKNNPKSLLAPEPVQPAGSRSGSKTSSRPASASGQRPSSRTSATNQRPSSRNSALVRPATATGSPSSQASVTNQRPSSRNSALGRPATATGGRPSSRASVTNQRPSSALGKPATAACRPPSRHEATTGTQTEFSREPSPEKTTTRVTSAPPTRRTYNEQLAARYKGHISLYERSPWKPSSIMPHNLYPRLHIHLSEKES